MWETIGETLITIFFLPFLFLAVFLAHEAGHYLVARFYGVGVQSFSIGAGRILWQRQKGEGKPPVYIRLWPISGHIALRNEDLRRLTPLKRIAIILAGPAANLILPFFLLLPFLLVFGLPVQPPVVGGIMLDSPADKAGLELGDVLVAANGNPMRRFEDLHDYTWELPLEPFTLTVERDGALLSFPLEAAVREYTDRTGIKRMHGQIGVQSGQAAYPLKNIRTINGEDVEDRYDRIRALLTAADGKVIIIGLYTWDENIYEYRVRVHMEANPFLNDPDDRERKRFFVSPLRDSYYIPLSPLEGLQEAFGLTAAKIKDIASLPLQLFPLDKTKLGYAPSLSDDRRIIRNELFKLIYRLTLLSIVIAFINLLPLPRLDGSMLLYELWEMKTGTQPTNRQRALLLAGAFGAAYLTVAIANAANIPVYFEKKIKNTREWIEDFGKD